jgi:hypothetical protein
MYDFHLLRRELFEGHETVVLNFRARPGYKTRTSDGKMFQRFTGQAWVSELEHELVRLDLELIEPVSFGFGLLAKLHKGAKFSMTRTKVNGEVWLPSKSDVSGSARLLLLKGLSVREITEYSDHRKYTVETIIKVPGTR